MSIKEELFEQYLLSESKEDFIKALIPDSYEHLYFQVLHALNTKPTLSEEDTKVLNHLKATYKHSSHQGHPLHSLDFQNLLRTLDSSKSTTQQREQALKDLHNYFNIRFNAVKPPASLQSNISNSENPGLVADFERQLESSLDQKIISFQNYLNQAYTSLHHLNSIAPFFLYKMDVSRLLTEGKGSREYAQILSTFVSNVPCLHQVKDVPKIYKAIYEDYQSRKQVYDFSQAGYDRLSISQLKELGVLLKDVVFETKEFQLALIKKLFYKDISKFQNKTFSNLTQEEKLQKKQQYGLIYQWAKENLPKKLQYLNRQLIQELVLLSAELNDFNKDLFLEYANNSPNQLHLFSASLKEQFNRDNIPRDNVWNQVFTFTRADNSTIIKLLDSYLLVFFQNADSIKPFDALFEENYLHRLFYRSKILSGQQDYITKAASILSKSDISTLVTSRQITILDRNNRYVQGNEEVKLQVETKNIQNLTVSIFEITTENYYLQKKTQFDSTVSLDGLIPLHTTQYTYKEPSNQVVLREFNLQPIQNATRGYFIVEFFGNSVSSRAVFKKGLLAIVETPTIAGHLVTIVDEKSNICKPEEGGRTGMWLNGRFHSANADGHIIIPYSQANEIPQAILVHNDYSELESFSVLTEEYQFECTYLYNQESFLQGNKAKIIIHPTFSINSVPANMAIIEEQLIKVSIKNHQDIPTALEFKDIKFDSKQDIEIEVPIQSIVKSIDVECSGVVKKMNGTKQNLHSTTKLTFDLHQSPLNQIFNLYLKKTDNLGYLIYALDKSGQPLEKVPIELQFTHTKIYQPFSATLQTDAEGKVILGQLENISIVQANVREFKNFPDINQHWTIMRNFKVEMPSEITIIEDETVEVPIPSEVELSRENLTFYSINQANYQDFVYDDLYEKVKKENGFLQISGLKEGTYVLNVLELQTHITIRVYNGKYWHNNPSFLITNNTFIAVDRSKDKLVTIRETLLVPQSEKEADILINLNLPKNFTEAQRNRLRVHVFAYNFLSNEQDNFVQSLRNNRVNRHLPRIDVQSTPANFLSNKKIGDEICYVYNRKTEQQRIGNTLEKPCVLLKRTFNRDTTFEKENLEVGKAYETQSLAKKAMNFGQKEMCYAKQDCSYRGGYAADCIQVCPPGSYHVKGEIDTFLNFLTFPCFVSSNHLVNEDGSVLVPGLEWKNYASIQVVVSSPNLAVSDIFPTTSEKTSSQDLRHQSSMKSDQFYTENFSSGKLHATQSLQISADSQTAVVGSIPEIFEIQKQIMKTGRQTDSYLGRDYSTWQFLKEWNTYTDKVKLEKYNEYACHEVNLFLYFKDTQFFKIVVEPFLRNKMQKTFIDFFLLNEKEQILKFSNTERINDLNVLEQALLILSLVKNNLKQRAEHLASSIENIQKTQHKNIDLQKRLFLTIIESSAKDEIKQAAQEMLLCDEPRMMECNERVKRCKMAAPMASMAMATRSMRMPESQMEMMSLHADYDEDCLGMDINTSLIEQRKEFKEGYKKLEKTTEYVERQYYGNNQTQDYVNLVKVNKFWSDLVRYIVNNNGIENFVSDNFVYAFNNHVEAISVLALMDISFSVRDNYDLNTLPARKIQVLARKNVIYFSKEIVQSAEISKANVSIIQTFFDPSDRFTTMKDDPSIRIEKEVEEFIVNKIYGCKVIITNISIANLNLSVLTEIPEGSIPVNSFEYTKSIDVSVNSYQTYNNIEFFFYFPKAGSFSIYRSNASRNGIIVAQANEIPPIVVKSAPEIKKMESLADILNNGSKEDILKFAKTQNLHDSTAFNINKILYFIQNDRAFFLSILEILREQGIFNRTVWEYSLHHNYEQGVLELLNNSEFRKTRLVNNYHQIQSLHSDILSYDNFAVFEYHPLLTSRVHSFMDQNKSKILNVQFKKTYFDYVNYLSHVSDITNTHYVVLAYYLILQERIDEALTVFNRIKEFKDSNSRIQYDYLSAYLDIYTGGPNFKKARDISQQYLEYPIISWRNLFVNLSNQLAEYDGEVLDESEIADDTDLSKNLKNAEKEQSVSFEISGKQLVVYYQNCDKAEINLYQLDIEVLFSTSPFMQGGDKNEFTFIKPNETIKLALQKQNTLEKKIVDIPSAYANKNLYISLASSSGVQNLSYFSSNLNVQLIEKYGQVKVLDQSNTPLQKVYVKCFAKYKDDSVAFFRDGYTDLRGRFDYALSSSNDITQVKQFSILICSEEQGSIIREAKPPTSSGRMETTISLLAKKK